MNKVQKRSYRVWLGWLIFALGALFYSYEYLLRILPGTMTQALMQWHGLDPAQLGWFASSYYVTYTLMQLPVGLLLDKFNPKYVLLAAMLACLLGNQAFSMDNLAIAIIGRVLVGLGSAFAFVGVLRLATLWLPSSAFALATGFVTTVGMVGGMVGDVALSPIVVKLGAESAIHMATILGLPILLALMFVPAKPREVSVDSTSHAAQSQAAWRELVSSLVSIVRMPWLWLNAMIGCFLYIPLSAFAELWGIPFLETTQHINPVAAGDAVSWLLLGWAVGAPLIGYIVDRCRRPLLVIMLGSGLASLAILVLLYSTFTSLVRLDFLLFLFGAASTGQILVMVLAKSGVGRHQQATAMAFTNMLIMFGGMIFQPLIGYLLKIQGHMVDGAMVYAADAYKYAMFVVPAALLLGMLLTLLLKYVVLPRSTNRLLTNTAPLVREDS